MSKPSATRVSPARQAPRQSKRPEGRDVRIVAWLFRHPTFVLAPAGVLAMLWAFGVVATVVAHAAVIMAGLVWWRAHPPSFDRHIAPHVRAGWRRWTCYRGARWAKVLDACGLTKEHRHTGETLVPRVIRVRSTTPTIDTLTVRMVRGQDITPWEENTSILADALIAQRVVVSRSRPGIVTVVVERELPFDRTIPVSPIAASSDEVDLAALDIGDNEHGEPFTISVRGGHRLVVAATGGGKGSIMWGTLHAIGPCIRDGIVRVWMVDLKGGVETDQGEPLFYRYATRGPAAITVLEEFRDRMLARQDWMRAHGIRECTPSVETPVELLDIDELAMLTAYGDAKLVRTALRLLAEIMTQGRASLFTVNAFLQEPTKDVVDVRDLFTQRLCLGVATASHVDMTLGDGMRDRGALADQIPGDARHAGIGFVIDGVSRMPVRFRAAYVTDNDIAELVQRCAPPDAQIIALHPGQHDEPDEPDVPDEDEESAARYWADRDDDHADPFDADPYAADHGYADDDEDEDGYDEGVS